MLMADGPGIITSFRAENDFELTADPLAPQWHVQGVFAEKGPQGEPAPGHRTEIRSRWTQNHLYLLYICPYAELNLKPDPSTTSETNRLWEWDVAEAFIGSDFKKIRRYKEFQVSPRGEWVGEWVDPDIDRDRPRPEEGWVWNSGFEVRARIDEGAKIWYGEMKIPFRALTGEVPRAGLQFRANLYRIQGPPPRRMLIAWQPTHQPTYHAPEAFGRLVLK